MRHRVIGLGLSLATLLLGVEVASAFAGRAIPAGTFGLTGPFTPIAMCGRTCSRGGRYIPGPPQVCYDQGLEYAAPRGTPRLHRLWWFQVSGLALKAAVAENIVTSSAREATAVAQSQSSETTEPFGG